MITPALSAGANPVTPRNLPEAARSYDPTLKQRHEPGAAPSLPNTDLASEGSGTVDGQRFLLRAIEITGATVISKDVLAATFRDLVGKDVGNSDLAAMANRMTAIYRDAGFSLSRAIVPPQEVIDGRVRVTIIEGFVQDIIVQGASNRDFGAEALLAPLRDEHPLRQQSLVRRLLLVNDTPGVRIADTALNEIGQMSGRFRLTVKLANWDVFVGAGIDNRGTVAVGRNQGYVNPAINSLLVPGDTLDFAFSSVPDQTNELRFGRAIYSAPIGNDGARIAGGFTYGEIRPGDIRRLYQDKTETQRFEIKGTIVPWKSREASLAVSLGGDIDNIRERADVGMVSDDHVRAITVSSDAELHDDLAGTNFVSVNLRQGFSVFGASDSGDPFLSRDDGSGSFTTASIYFTRFQKIDDAWSLKLSAAGQIASRPLLASEEFYLGGAAFGRAYDAGAISGDEALATSLELRYDGRANTDFTNAYQLYTFADYGAAWNIHDGGDTYLDVASVGGGVRLFMKDDFEGSVEIATPLARRWNDVRDVSIYFSLSKSWKACPTQPHYTCPAL